jgi:hypothetical protein
MLSRLIPVRVDKKQNYVGDAGGGILYDREAEGLICVPYESILTSSYRWKASFVISYKITHANCVTSH